MMLLSVYTLKQTKKYAFISLYTEPTKQINDAFISLYTKASKKICFYKPEQTNK